MSDTTVPEPGPWKIPDLRHVPLAEIVGLDLPGRPVEDVKPCPDFASAI